MQLNPNLIESLYDRLARNSIATDFDTLSSYSYDASKTESLPEAVLFPYTKDDVVSIVKIAKENSIPVIACGAATGLTGGAVAINGGLIVSLEKMNRIIAIDPNEKIAIVEPGVINADLAERLKKHNLMFPCEPSSAAFSTIGGNLAENSCGYKGRLYGSCSAHVAGIVYVNNEGEFISTGHFSNNTNRVSERLLAGSEGTLGIIVRIALKLQPLPKSYSTSMLFFDSDNSAIEAAQILVKEGNPPASIEYIDNATLDVITDKQNVYIVPEGKSALILEYDYNTENRYAFNGLVKHLPAKNASERDSMWDFRDSISPLLYKIAQDKLNEDVAVPINRLSEFVSFIDFLRNKAKFSKLYCFGHLSVGCFHATFMFNKSETEAASEVELLVTELLGKVTELEGTISCEHGIGVTKKRFMNLEMDETALEFHRNIKNAFDPDAIFNPGKIT